MYFGKYKHDTCGNTYDLAWDFDAPLLYGLVSLLFHDSLRYWCCLVIGMVSLVRIGMSNQSTALRGLICHYLEAENTLSSKQGIFMGKIPKIPRYLEVRLKAIEKRPKSDSTSVHATPSTSVGT